MKAVVYGAGNIGRGFIGPVFSEAGYKVTFIDVNETIVNSLNKAGSYPLRLVSNDGFKEIIINDVNAIISTDEALVTESIAEADVMATAVGVRQLPFIAPGIADGLKKRRLKNGSALNIIICENLIDADKYLSSLIRSRLDAADGDWLSENIGFVESSIGRMVPIQTPRMQDGNILRICTEEYGFLPVNKDAFTGKTPVIPGMVPFSGFSFYIQRKLFVHNMGHAICAFLGLLFGDVYISDAVSRSDVFLIAQNAMMESALALHRKFNVSFSDLTEHIKDLLFRFNNRALMDTCVRVGADAERKLGPSDRFIGAINCCKELGVEPAFVSIGAAAALYSLLNEKKLAQTEDNAQMLLGKTASMGINSEEASFILIIYRKISGGINTGELISIALQKSAKTVL